MQYQCLRNCYVGELLWKEGKVYDLPDAMDKDPKNFRLVGETAEEAESNLNAEYDVQRLKDEAAAKATADALAVVEDKIPVNSYWCTDCEKYHSEDIQKSTGKMTKISKKHQKFKGLKPVPE